MSKKKIKPLTPLGMEKDMKELMDHLKEQNFASMDEANAYLQTMMGKPLSEALPKKNRGKSDQQKAQDLVLQAYEAGSEIKALQLIEKALQLDPSNVDALCLKAETSRDVELAIHYYRQAVDAGKRALGKDFEEYQGHFWGFHQTRPFMRAKAGLAAALYFWGSFKEAISEYWEMLKLNPNDNQGIRYSLSTCLLEQNDFEGYKKLHKLFADDGMASSLYNYSLFLFKTEGSSPKSDKALRSALKQNAFVPKFLLEEIKLPKQLPSYIGFGDENEAIDYVTANLMLWQKTPMALMWLSKHYRK